MQRSRKGKNLSWVLHNLVRTKHIDIDGVKKPILSIKGAKRVHDAHVWSMEGKTGILTAHVLVEGKYLKNQDRIKNPSKTN